MFTWKPRRAEAAVHLVAWHPEQPAACGTGGQGGCAASNRSGCCCCCCDLIASARQAVVGIRHFPAWHSYTTPPHWRFLQRRCRLVVDAMGSNKPQQRTAELGHW